MKRLGEFWRGGGLFPCIGELVPGHSAGFDSLFYVFFFNFLRSCSTFQHRCKMFSDAFSEK